MKIQDAFYKRDNKIEIISAMQLSRKDYATKYRGFLYCIEPDCNALLSFVEWKKHNTKFFRTWSKSKHKNGCPCEVLYGDPARNSSFISGQEFTNLTDEHIKDKLKRAFESVSCKIHKPFINKALKNKKPTGNIIESNILYPALFDEGEDNASAKQPYILTRPFDKLDENDIGKVRCVYGTVKSIRLFKNHGYINLTNKGPNSVKICFNEAFVKSEINRNQYPNFEVLNVYFNDPRNDEVPVICCCVGRLGLAKTGINIYPDRYNGFTLNGLGYYDLINEYYHKCRFQY